MVEVMTFTTYQSHYLNKCQLIVNWILMYKLKSISNQITKVYKNTAEKLSTNQRESCSGFDFFHNVFQGEITISASLNTSTTTIILWFIISLHPGPKGMLTHIGSWEQLSFKYFNAMHISCCASIPVAKIKCHIQKANWSGCVSFYLQFDKYDLEDQIKIFQVNARCNIVRYGTVIVQAEIKRYQIFHYRSSLG